MNRIRRPQQLKVKSISSNDFTNAAHKMAIWSEFALVSREFLLQLSHDTKQLLYEASYPIQSLLFPFHSLIHDGSLSRVFSNANPNPSPKS